MTTDAQRAADARHEAFCRTWSPAASARDFVPVDVEADR